MPKVVAYGLLVLLGVTVGVYGAMNLFTQSFNSVPASTSVLTALCTQVFSSPPSVAPGSSGGLFFGCAGVSCTTLCPLTGPGITVATDGAATPTFSLPTFYTNVTLVNQGTTPPTTGCTTHSGPTFLTSGTPFSFTGTYGKGNSFYYCVGYAAPPGTTSLPAFTVAWTQ